MARVHDKIFLFFVLRREDNGGLGVLVHALAVA
jgi:hypothetical protein